MNVRFARQRVNCSIQTLQGLADRARTALDNNDADTGRLLETEMATALESLCGGIYDLIEATYICHFGLGDMDQRQRLGNQLEDFKRRVLGGESPSGEPLQELRNEKIKGLVQEILVGLDKKGWIKCTSCGQDRPPVTPLKPQCPTCGFDPTGVGV